MTTNLTCDIETVPDVQGIRTLYELQSSLPDDEVVLFDQQKQRAQTGGDFMQHHLHQIVAISRRMRWGQDKVHVGTIGEMDDGEEVLIAKLCELIENIRRNWSVGTAAVSICPYCITAA